MITVRLLPDLTGPMDYQMALDEVLLQSFKLSRNLGHNPAPLMRFFDTCESWKTLGYTMPLTAALNSKDKICRRITGGGWVDHGSDLVFSLIAHRAHDISFGSVLESYRKIHDSLSFGFKSKNIQTDLYPDETGHARGIQCFLSPIQSDLKRGNKKIAGGAQKRSEGSFLHQESIQLEQVPLMRTEIKKACLKGLETICGWRFESAVLNPALLREAEKLRVQKYANPEFVKNAGRGLGESEADE